MMNKDDRIDIDDFADGIASVKLEHWSRFDAAVRQLADDPDFIFRGQDRAKWELTSTLARELGPEHSRFTRERREVHLKEFQRAVRGRRGPNPQQLDEVGWWALAQEYGMPTPLLDWTESPFVAAYFAFWKPVDWPEGEAHERAVFALLRSEVGSASRRLAKTSKTGLAQRGLSVEMPETDDNARFVNQRGVFCYMPSGETIEAWVRRRYRGSKTMAMIKFVIPDNGTDRVDFLTYLERMNITHVTLFPDICGAAEYCKLKLQIDTSLHRDVY